VIPIDELVEIWIRVHNEALARYAHNDDLTGVERLRKELAWWGEACKCFRPTPEDDEIIEKLDASDDPLV
jgi:hypothetical protein